MLSPTGPRRRRPGPPDGVPTVFAADEQADREVPVARLTALAESVLAAEGVRGDGELSLLFVSQEVIAELNGRFLDGDGPTDVLAFPLDAEPVEGGRTPDGSTTGPDRPPPTPGDVPLLLGDVLVCPAVAARNAADAGRRYGDELDLLVVHGVLHVLGRDHAEPAEAAEMQARERELLTAFGGGDGDGDGDGGGGGQADGHP